MPKPDERAFQVDPQIVSTAATILEENNIFTNMPLYPKILQYCIGLLVSGMNEKDINSDTINLFFSKFEE